jgi:hypothetical protein
MAEIKTIQKQLKEVAQHKINQSDNQIMALERTVEALKQLMDN